MEIVSTSSLIFSENKKRTTCNFQTMAMNSSVMLQDLMRGQIGRHAFVQI